MHVCMCVLFAALVVEDVVQLVVGVVLTQLAVDVGATRLRSQTGLVEHLQERI